MKKTYINPEMNVIEIQTQQLLAGSTISISGTTDDPSTADSRILEDWEF